MEDEELDEDVFLEETLLHYEEEDSQRSALADRLVKWKRPPLSDAYQSQSRNIGNYSLIVEEIVTLLL